MLSYNDKNNFDLLKYIPISRPITLSMNSHKQEELFIKFYFETFQNKILVSYNLCTKKLFHKFVFRVLF